MLPKCLQMWGRSGGSLPYSAQLESIMAVLHTSLISKAFGLQFLALRYYL